MDMNEWEIANQASEKYGNKGYPTGKKKSKFDVLIYKREEVTSALTNKTIPKHNAELIQFWIEKRLVPNFEHEFEKWKEDYKEQKGMQKDTQRYDIDIC